MSENENLLHAHVYTTSSDCDGVLDFDYVVDLNDDEVAESQQDVNDFSDISFMNRVMAAVAGPYAVESMTVTVDQVGIEVHETTEEGYRERSVRWCRDDCGRKWTYRDHRAEAAGY